MLQNSEGKTPSQKIHCYRIAVVLASDGCEMQKKKKKCSFTSKVGQPFFSNDSLQGKTVGNFAKPGILNLTSTGNPARSQGLNVRRRGRPQHCYRPQPRSNPNLKLGRPTHYWPTYRDQRRETPWNFVSRVPFCTRAAAQKQSCIMEQDSQFIVAIK